jgi:SH3-like domain-containing protein
MNLKRFFLPILTGATLTFGFALPALAVPATLVGDQPGSRINVRSTPSLNASSPHYGLVGDRVEVLRSETVNGFPWRYVRFGSGAEGWVRGDFVRLSPVNQSALLIGNEPGSRINVRSAPSLNASSPHYGLVGDRVTVIRFTTGAAGDRWYYIRFSSGAEGWVRADFVQIDEDDQRG